MLILKVILAASAVAALGLGPRSSKAAAGALAAAALDGALGARIGPALGVAAPLLAFLAAVLTLAALVEASGLARRAASLLEAAARGRAMRLYGLVCVLAAILTVAVSLDGAVVLAVPLLRALGTDAKRAFAPLFLGVVAVCNAVSIAVPQGNPTNLVVIGELRISPAAFAAHMLGPGLAAATLCAVGIALAERSALAGRWSAARRLRTPLSSDERRAALVLAAAALAGWLAPLAGVAPWWGFAVAVALLMPWRARPRLLVPWRIAAQVAALVVTLEALRVPLPGPGSGSLASLLAVALLAAGAAALVNNLPASATAASLLAAGPSAYAASLGLAIGALSTPQGSVATLIASDLAGPEAPALRIRLLAPLALVGVLAATLLLRASL